MGDKATAIDWDFLDEEREVKSTEKGLPGRKECMEEMCARCMGYYYDGKDDCLDPTCPLYPYYSHAAQDPDLRWRTKSPRLQANRRQFRFEIERVNRRPKKSKQKKAPAKKKAASKRKK